MSIKSPVFLGGVGTSPNGTEANKVDSLFGCLVKWVTSVIKLLLLFVCEKVDKTDTHRPARSFFIVMKCAQAGRSTV